MSTTRIYRAIVEKADERGIYVSVPDRANAVYGPLEILVPAAEVTPQYEPGDRVLVGTIGVVQEDDFIILGHRRRHDGTGSTSW